MWIFMLMMMVTALTRKRSQAQNPNLDGSLIVQNPPRKRSHRLSKKVANSVSADAPPHTLNAAVAPIGQPSGAAITHTGQPNGVAVAPTAQTSGVAVAPTGQLSSAAVAPTGQPSAAAVAPTGQPIAAAVAPTGQQPADQELVNPPKKRGPNTNAKLSKTLEGMPAGSKISLKMDNNTMNFVGGSAITFATECGIIIRNVCPMKYHRWDLIPQDDKDVMYEKLQGKFELLRTDKKFMGYVNARLHEHWKRYRGELSKHWKSVGGKTNPQLAKQNIKPGCRVEHWNDLCKYWEMESTQKYSKKMEENRKKLTNVSRAGPRSIANLVYKMTNTETQVPPSPLEVYHNLHYNPDKNGWLNDHTRVDYETICKHKQAAVDKLKDEGTTEITTAMQHEIERQAIKSVCGRKKTIQSGWEVGVGLVMKKKDSWMKDVAESSQQANSTSQQDSTTTTTTTEIIQLRKQVSELEVYKSNYQKMAEFMRQKFPDFEATIASPITNEADSSDEVFTNSDM